jgi:EmrB/QacA subfamily drug resistance transporter
MAIIGVPMLLGPILGPILGGWLVDDVSWRWIFFINLPIGIFALILALRILPKDTTSKHEPFDALGLFLLSPGLALVIYGLAKSTSSGGFGATQVWATALAGFILLGVFVWHALRTPHALVDLRLFKNGTFTISSLTLVLMIISVFGAMLLLPLYFQNVRGESALDAGLLLAPQGIGAMLMMPIAGTLTDKTGIGKIVTPGLVIIFLSVLGLTQLDGDTSYWVTSAILFVQGIGMGFAMMPLFSGAMQTLRKAAVARASTTLNIIQQMGASIGTAVMSVLLTNAIHDRFGGQAGIGTAPGTKLPASIADKLADAFTHTFWIAAFLIIPAFIAALFLPKRRPEPIEDDEGGAGESAPVLMHA